VFKVKFHYCDTACDFFAENLVAEQVAVVEFGHYHSVSKQGTLIVFDPKHNTADHIDRTNQEKNTFEEIRTRTIKEKKTNVVKVENHAVCTCASCTCAKYTCYVITPYS